MATMNKRVNVGLTDEKYKFFKDKADKSGVPVSTVITMALDQYIDSQKVIDSLPDLLEQIKKAQNRG